MSVFFLPCEDVYETPAVQNLQHRMLIVQLLDTFTVIQKQSYRISGQGHSVAEFFDDSKMIWH